MFLPHTDLRGVKSGCGSAVRGAIVVLFQVRNDGGRGSAKWRAFAGLTDSGA